MDHSTRPSVISRWAIPCIFFIVAFVVGPFSQLNYLASMPGDIGDARLNNYFLENIYLFMRGAGTSLWQLGFFYPFPYVGGFSDNLFGAAPVYLVSRLLNQEPDTSFQIWFLFGYAANFASCYFALRLLGGSVFASSIGALIFAFSLPTTAHAGHAQLHYRFGIPLALAYFLRFLDRKDWGALLFSGVWCVWQFYCTIYMGFFTLLMLAAIIVVYIVLLLVPHWTSFAASLKEYVISWQSQTPAKQRGIALGLLALCCAMLLLFWPYLQVAHLYGAKRGWSEIAAMLPRPQSYFLSDASLIWSSPGARAFAGLPMRGEHQMFIGAIPMLLAVAGLILRWRRRDDTFALLAGAHVVVIVATLYIGGFSLWYLFHKFPLASAIRAMTRIDQMLLFSVAYLGMVAIDQCQIRWRGSTKVFACCVLPLLVLEFSSTKMGVSPKSEWRDRLDFKDKEVPSSSSPDDIFFFAQKGVPSYAEELDSMWVSLIRGRKTLNGYSGLNPPGYAASFGDNCQELTRRILLYLSFAGRGGDEMAFRDLRARIIPLGFSACTPEPFSSARRLSVTNRVYTAAQVQDLTYVYDRQERKYGRTVVYFKIRNRGNESVSAISAIGKPIRVSWRFLDKAGKPVSGWDARADLPYDIPAHGELSASFDVAPDTEIKGGTLQVSLVQEGVFWAFDAGLAPMDIAWE